MPTLSAQASQHKLLFTGGTTTLLAQQWHFEKGLRSFYLAWGSTILQLIGQRENPLTFIDDGIIDEIAIELD